MKTKSFQKYLETRLTKQEIAEIRQQAQLDLSAEANKKRRRRLKF